jgi:O-antigen/teichoic acid export membrane protein
MQLRSFIQQAAGVGAVSLVDRAVAVGVGIIFARWLGPAQFGAYSFVIAAVGLLLLPARLGLPELLTRDIAASRGSAATVNVRATIRKGYLLVGVAALAIVLIGQVALQLAPQTSLGELMKFGLWLIVPAAFFEVTIGVLRGWVAPCRSNSMEHCSCRG